MKLNYSQKILALSVIVAIGVLVLNLVFGGLLVDKIISVNDKVRQLTISPQVRERNMNLKNSILNTEGERAKLDKYFIGPGDISTAEFISYLEVLSKETGVISNIKSVGYNPVTGLNASSVVSSVQLKIALTGKWSNIFNFLQLIENLPRVVQIQEVSLSSNTSSDNSSNSKSLGQTWSMDINFSVVKLK